MRQATEFERDAKLNEYNYKFKAVSSKVPLKLLPNTSDKGQSYSTAAKKFSASSSVKRQKTNKAFFL